jgi:hypothetical protein
MGKGVVESLMIYLLLGFFKLADIGQRDNTFVGARDSGDRAEHIFLNMIFIDEFAFKIRHNLVKFCLIRNNLTTADFTLRLLIDKMQPGFYIFNFIFFKTRNVDELGIGQ